MTTVHCTLIVPSDQVLLAKALWSELGLDDFEFVHDAELSPNERLIEGPVREVFGLALRCPHALHDMAAARGMDLDFDQFTQLCTTARVSLREKRS